MSLSIEPELITAARDGDRESLERLLEIAWPHAFRIANSVLRNATAAEDAAQEACATVYRTIRSLRATNAFRAWFYRIVVRHAILAAQNTSNAGLEEANALASPGDPTQTIDLEDALAKLPVVLRTTLVLHYYAGLNSSELGAAMGAPAATVRFRLADARRRLAPLLEDRSASISPRTYEVVL